MRHTNAYLGICEDTCEDMLFKRLEANLGCAAGFFSLPFARFRLQRAIRQVYSGVAPFGLCDAWHWHACWADVYGAC